MGNFQGNNDGLCIIFCPYLRQDDNKLQVHEKEIRYHKF